ncbi:nuclear transport factor 2 family protein [Nocardioides sp. zg-536]|uniref:Nuclear transport factor 2 family protein n=1 Tax=Nocardioides faecalis TaxID=2803858 RepID=A0A939BWF3_9ACTN|nr:nuclear transport factor 2 family protein [Nocardioides faecalis]MBM9458338.1 nuclear transport factor 2 family protein [Nocardioides faecalis]MBS4753361.1 nuclear transport factor 2 family protein [Nocardioides faecalis]QVI58363.1 nuclear transport factor 2 family protein [Nocardioides faecalis]
MADRTNHDAAATVTAQLAALTQRVRALEDVEAVREVVTAYGPAVDAGDAEAVGRLWTDDAVYDLDLKVFTGREEIVEMVRTAPHQDYLAEGCGHLLDPVHVRVDGDEAVATCHSMLLRRSSDEDSFWVWRVSANRFELVRSEGGWLIRRRTARVLDGRASARELLGRVRS